MVKRAFVIILLLLLFRSTIFAQLSGSYTVPGSFPNLSTAINSLNIQGVSGPVTINIAAGYTETTSVGGFSLTATGTAANPITFKKNGAGANPKLYAYSGGIATPISNVQDGIWRLVGSDFITIDGIDIFDPNPSNPATMEYGYGFFKASPTDGCQNNTIKNCTITLNRINNGPNLSSPYTLGSRGIDITNSLPSSYTVSVNVASSLGSNSYNKFYSNVIQNCNVGISLYGNWVPANPSFADIGNDIGGTTATTGNKIIDYGGAPTATAEAHAVNANQQVDINISNNLINNNTGAGFDHPATFDGIYINAGSYTGTISLKNNTISVHGGNAYTSLSAMNLSGFTYTTGTAFIDNNLITNCTFTNSISNNFYGIYLNNNIAATVTINNNTITNISTAASSNTIFGIYAFSPAAYSCSIDNNYLSNFTLTSTTSTTSTEFCGIYGIGLVSQTYSSSISGNSLQAVNYSGTTMGKFSFIFTSTSNSNINNNKLINVTVPTSNYVYNIYNYSSQGVANVKNNSIGSLTNPVSGIHAYGYYTPYANGGTLTISNNDFSNVTLTGGTNYFGAFVSTTSNTQVSIVNNNTVAAIITGSGAINGLEIQTSLPGGTVKNNLIYNLNSDYVNGLNITSTGSNLTVESNTCHTINSDTPTGIRVAGTEGGKVRKNRVFDIFGAGGGGVCGMSCSGIREVSNNLVGRLYSPNGGGQFAIEGIYISGTITSTTNVCYNSVFLNATSSSSQFGSYALYHNGGLMKLNNNVLVNTSGQNGTGLTVALGEYLNTYYHLGSNNNLFSIGPAGTFRRLFYDGLNYPTLAIFQTSLSPRECNSIEELPTFISTNGFHPHFLKPNPTVSTQIESGGVPIPGITDDYPNTIRNTSTPDIGAWEDYYFVADSVSPSINGVAQANGPCNLTGITVTATISDATGVASASLSPRCYYKINSGPFSSVQGTLINGNYTNGVWQFSPTYVAVPGNTLSFYIIAQDILAPTNIGSSPPNGLIATNVNTVTNPPNSTYTIGIIGVLNGTYNVGTAGNFTTLTSAANAWNTWCITGPVTFLLTDPLYSTSENFPITFLNNPGANNTYSLLLRPAAANSASVIGGANDRTTIKFLESKYVTMDGINSGGTSLTVVNNQSLTSTCLWIASLNPPANSCKKITIKNTNVVGGGNYTNDNWGILLAEDWIFPSNAAILYADSISILDNNIYRTKIALNASGAFTNYINNLSVLNNTIGPIISNTNNLSGTGIFLRNISKSLVKGNLIQNILSYNPGTTGIHLEYSDNVCVTENTMTAIASNTATGGGPTTISGMRIVNDCKNNLISRNVVNNITNIASGWYGARGVTIQTSTNSINNKFENNFIGNIYAKCGITTQFMNLGLAMEGATRGFNIYNNTISMMGNYNYGPFMSASAAMYVWTSTFNNNYKNNIFSNTYDDNSTGKHIAYSVYSTAGALSYASMDHNNYYVGGTADSLVLSHNNNLQQFTLPVLQSSFGSNLNSVNVLPNFVSQSDLHLINTTNPSLNNAASPISGLTTDIDFDVRSSTNPDIGADEFYSTPCNAVTGSTQSALYTNSCNSQSVYLSSSQSIGYGLNYRGRSLLHQMVPTPMLPEAQAKPLQVTPALRYQPVHIIL